MLELEDNDQLDVMLETVGGGEDDEEKAVEGPITIQVKDGTGDLMHFKVKKQTRMEKIFAAYAQRKGK